MSLLSMYIRHSFKKGDDKRDAGLSTPDDILRKDDILYGDDRKWQVMDIYYPKNRKQDKLPVIVSVHGGGWVYGDKQRYQYYCMDLAQRGFAVVNFTYRLAPNFKYPAQLEDVNLVFDWVMKHGNEYDLDTDNIFAVGDSAGGHLLSLYCCFLNDPDVAKEYDFKAPEGLKIKAVGLNCGVYEIRFDEKGLTKTLMKDLLKGKGTEKELKQISPLYHVCEGFPATFVMTATGDFLLEQAMPMYEALKGKGVEAEYHCYGDEVNRLPHVFHCNIRTEDARICNDDECVFFASRIS
ncbi:MAG: alpha/beta hydrolase [Erysipelotrichaceae bacterium]|nr:alpha/beta hydrolase [Erysipelotrichaceae bacterium]